MGSSQLCGTQHRPWNPTILFYVQKNNCFATKTKRSKESFVSQSCLPYRSFLPDGKITPNLRPTWSRSTRVLYLNAYRYFTRSVKIQVVAATALRAPSPKNSSRSCQFGSTGILLLRPLPLYSRSHPCFAITDPLRVL